MARDTMLEVAGPWRSMIYGNQRDPMLAAEPWRSMIYGGNPTAYIDPSTMQYGVDAMYPSHESTMTAAEPDTGGGGGDNLASILAGLTEKANNVSIPSVPPVSEIQKIVGINPYGFSNPEKYVQGKNAQLDKLMLGLQRTLSAKRSNKITAPEVIQALLSVAAGVRGITSEDESVRNSGIQAALGGLQAIKQGRADREAKDAEAKKQAVDIVKLFEEVISGQSNRAISAAQTGNTSKQNTIDNYNQQTFGYPLEKAKADIGKLSLQYQIEKNKSDENKLSLQELRDQRSHKFYTDNIGAFIDPKDGSVDSKGFMNAVAKYHPEMYPDMKKLLGYEDKDTTGDLLKRADTILESTYVVEYTDPASQRTVKGLVDPENPDGPPISPTDTRYARVRKLWRDEAMRTAISDAGMGDSSDPSVSDAGSWFYKRRKIQEDAAAEAKRKAAINQQIQNDYTSQLLMEHKF